MWVLPVIYRIGYNGITQVEVCTQNEAFCVILVINQRDSISEQEITYNPKIDCQKTITSC